MTTKPKARKFRIRRSRPVSGDASAAAGASPIAEDQAARPASNESFTSRRDDGFGDKPFPGSAAARRPSRPTENPAEVQAALEAIASEGLTGRQLRMARRLAAKNGLTPASDFDAVRLLRARGIDPFERSSLLELVVPEQNDVSLQERCTRINDYHKKYQNKYKPITISLHGNAAGVGSASGIEAFTSVGYTMADPIAETLLTRLEKMNWNMRYGWGDPDGVSDKDKEMHFFILKHTMTPTILLELGFYTNYKECMKMLKASTQKKFARLLSNGLKEVEKTAIEIGI